MAILVDVKGQGKVEFPDGTPKETMLQALRRRFGTVAKGNLGTLEAIGTMATGAIAEPLSGLAGIAGAVLPGKSGQGAEWVQATQDALTYQPRTQAGQERLQSVGEFLQPVGEVMQKASQNLGDKAYSATGSPALAAAAYSVPTAIAEGVGLKGVNILRKPVSRENLFAARMGMGDIPPQYRDNFNAWFEGSQMIDSEGKPQVLYHGTNAGNFEAFDPSASSGLTDANGAMFFSSSPENASGYALRGKAKKDGGKVVQPVYLNVKNPLVLDFTKDPTANWSQFEIKSPDFEIDPETRRPRPRTQEEKDAITSPIMTRELAEAIVEHKEKVPRKSLAFSDNVTRIMQRGVVMDINELTKIARLMGKDALIAKGIFDAGKKTNMVKQDTVAVFNPEQIKSALGNSGEFSKASKKTSE